MVKYFENGELAIINDFCFRVDKSTGYFLSSKAINGKRKRLHVYVWELYNGKVENGKHIHHKDGNKNNNDIDNLEQISSSEHSKLHGSQIQEDRKIAMHDNLIKNAIPKSKAWHSSKDGIEWHKNHCKKVMANLSEIQCIS